MMLSFLALNSLPSFSPIFCSKFFVFFGNINVNSYCMTNISQPLRSETCMENDILLLA